MDLIPCQVDIESCSCTSFASNSLSLEPPSHVDHCANDKNVSSWGDVEAYDFIGVGLLLSHDCVVIAHLLVRINIFWVWIENMYRLVVGVQTFWWKDPLILNFKKRKK